MTFGINRVHGSLISPKNFAGVALQDFTLTFVDGAPAGVALRADVGVANGALDQVFRTAVPTVASLSRVGTVTTGSTTGANFVHFAIESLGFESTDNSGAGFLGTGPTNASPANTAAAIQAAIQALGTVDGVALGSATVAAFVY